MDPAAWAPPYMTPHAIRCFAERIEPMEPEACQTWFDFMWARRKKAPASERTHLFHARYKGEMRDYLVARSPCGKVVYYALSPDRSAVVTVFDLLHWNFLGGKTGIKGATSHRERIMRTLLEREDAGR